MNNYYLNFYSKIPLKAFDGSFIRLISGIILCKSGSIDNDFVAYDDTELDFLDKRLLIFKHHSGNFTVTVKFGDKLITVNTISSPIIDTVDINIRFLHKQSFKDADVKAISCYLGTFNKIFSKEHTDILDIYNLINAEVSKRLLLLTQWLESEKIKEV